MIHVIADIDVAVGKRGEFLAVFRDLVPLVRAESGCIAYGPAVDVATPIEIQQPVRGDAVTVIEQWESIDALQTHLQSPHMQTYFEQVKELVTGVQIRVLEPA